MSFPVQKKLVSLLILSLSGSALSADGLPPLRVDPALLGLPAAPVTEAKKENKAETKQETKQEIKAESKQENKQEAKQDTKQENTQEIKQVTTSQVAPIAPKSAAQAASKADEASSQKSEQATAVAVQPKTESKTQVQSDKVESGPALKAERVLPAAESPVNEAAPLTVPTTTTPKTTPAPAIVATPASREPAPVKVTIASPTPDTPSAKHMPLFRVDPALLGEAPIVAPIVAQKESQKESQKAAPAMQPPDVAERPSVASLYSAHVEAGLLPDSGEPLALKRSARLKPLPPEGSPILVKGLSGTSANPTPESSGDQSGHHSYPVFLSASRIKSRDDNEVEADGNVEMHKGNTTLTADHETYWRIDDEIEATGNVRLVRNADVMTGPKLRLNMTDSTGVFEQPQYAITRAKKIPQQKSSLLASAKAPPLEVIAGEVVSDPRWLTTVSGEADRLEFQGENRIRMDNATYSTCRVDRRSWYAQAREITLDHDRGEGEARDARVMFMGVPLFYSPWLSFSLDDQRKSGFLSPTFGASSNTGTELTVPYYWNIAPNMDATIAPRLMTKRGLQLGGEFRYLKPNYRGEISGEWLPEDAIVHKSRSSYSLKHDQNFGYGFTGSLNLNGVSDDTYFTDLSSRITTTSQTNLLRQGLLTYSGDWWSATANVQRYQTLQDPALPPVAVPYDRTPQVTVVANKPDVYGAALAFNGEYVNFKKPTDVVGSRLTMYPQVSVPWQTPAWYVTPKIGYHMSRYDLSRQALGTPDKINRNVPIFSVDSGLTFEREMSWQGKSLTQTLEPRLYYLNVPGRNQDLIPNFDSGLSDFNFASIFSENVFAGGDRIADANQVTAALTSRILDPKTGEEYIRGLIGQRYYFNNQEVTLPGVPTRPGGVSDFLAAVSGRVTEKSYVDTAWQYNPRERHSERFSLGARWQPDVTKVLNASYRYTRDSSAALQGIRQIDLSGQWPLGQGWYAVGRYNYSLRDSRLIESVAGLEYDAGCWTSRFVLQRFATTTGTNNTAIFIQLELNGFSRIGSNPLEILKRNIQGYGIINQPTADPAFGAQ